uniref:Cytochrome P450 n=1 Tax=Panagrolaimus sp. JU765 TaxID=591449 RepID=A0AC34RGF9_9BILA
MVIVGDYKLMNNYFVKEYPEALSGRNQFVEHLKVIRGGINGIIEVDGDLWKEQRRFALQVLRDFGLGKNVMEEKVLDEVSALLKNLAEDEKTGICDIIGRIDVCVGSVINNLLFGYRFEGSHLQEFHNLKKNLQDFFVQVNKGPSLLYFSFYKLRYVPFFKDYAEKIYELNKSIFDFLENQIYNHEKSINYESESFPTDFCEAYLKEMNHQQKINGIKKDYYNFIQFKNVCFDLWIAGLETTSTTLQFAMIYLLNFPQVLEKVQKELDNVVEHDKMVTLNDRMKLPYLQAVISEIQRMTNLLLFNVMHKTMKDVIIEGYKIDKGIMVIPQISCVLYDEKIFPEPFSFKPDRFLDEEGNYKKYEEMIPFSLGKRSCLGESLAKTELFLILGNVLKHFDIMPEKPGQLPSMEKRWGVTVQPEPFKIQVKKRF